MSKKKKKKKKTGLTNGIARANYPMFSVSDEITLLIL
jgi:hypothetical protein